MGNMTRREKITLAVLAVVAVGVVLLLMVRCVCWDCML